MNAHLQTLEELKGWVPVMVLYEEPFVGKNSIATAAMNMLGIEA